MSSLPSKGSRSAGSIQRPHVKSSATPSPSSLRAKVLNNCISAIKSKRYDILKKIRMESGDNRDALVTDLVNEAYSATRMQDRMKAGDPQASGSHQRGEISIEEDLGSQEHQALLQQIAEALEHEYELALQAGEYYDEQFLEGWQDQYPEEELYQDEDEASTNSGIICPICM